MTRRAQLVPARLVRALPALVILAAALALIPAKMALNEVLGQDVGYVPSVMVVILGAWLGFVPGLVATLAVVLVDVFVFLEPRGDLSQANSPDRLRIVLVALGGLFASGLARLRTRAEQTATIALDETTRARDRADLLVRRLGALQGLAAELGGAVTTAQIADALVTQAAAALRADGTAVLLLEPGGDAIRVAAWTGTADERLPAMGHVPLDETLPAADVARTGESVFIEDPAKSEARYGASLRRLGIGPEPRAYAVVPMELEGKRFGVLVNTWNGAHDLDADRQAFIESIARLGAGAFERSRLLDVEGRARRHIEAAQRRLDLLAEAGRVLGLSLEYEVTLRRLAGLALPLLGDVGIVDVLEQDGMRRHVASAEDNLAAAASVIEAHPVEPDAGGPIAGVLIRGHATLYAVDEAVIVAMASSASHAAALRTVGARWLLVTPLRVQGRTIGSLAFLRRDDRAFDPEEVAIAEELGDRAGRALENARLHQQVARLADRERRHAAELEAVIGAIGEGILVTDPDGVIRSSNEAATRLLGGQVARVRDVLDRLLDAGDHRPAALTSNPTEYRLADRSTAWVELASYAVPAADGVNAASAVIVCRDVTAFRQGQALREAFLGLLSHELRTPVTTIYGGSSVLTRPGNQLGPQVQVDILEDIAGEADRLYRLVEDLLVLARFDEGFELGAEPILLQHLVPIVTEQERGRWPAIRVQLAIEPDVPIVGGDETSITQVLRNLLSNAAKYSEAGSTITVVVEPVPEGVVVRVCDEGPGIEPDELPHLFDPFYRSPSTAKLAAGAGIGLYVSRRLVDAMGGRIWASPRPTGGLEFSFVIPPYRGDPEED